MATRLTHAVLALVLAAAVGSAGESQAKSGAPRSPEKAPCKRLNVEQVIRHVDRNRDGKLSHAEWRAQGLPESSFRALSKGKDYIAAKDFRAATPPPGIDANGDCILTVQEFKDFDKKMSARTGGTRPPSAPAHP